MTIQLKSVLTLALVSFALPGCSLFGGPRMADRTGSEQQMQVSAKALAARPAAFTDAGRRALNEGSAGLAIEAFTRAVTSGEAPAPAFNGLGVAYARIGRVDLAQRYFERAAQVDPADTRYQTNLARLLRSPLYAKRHQADEANAMLARAEQARSVEERSRQAAAPGQLQRIGANQFMIRTAPLAASAGPVRTAMVVARTKPRLADTASVEAKFDSAIGKGEAAAAPAEDQPKSRTVLFKPAAAAKR
ncbi:hypothetical protein B0I00_2114 [Novosphingobium kunmingense]|uniref:Uncharacterized protein n=1 Tax=Novosphingobium kunmingense TaxID=1211806 RepID=A0A2N0H6F0_9SPHN|nr:hypothetical protein [Novosphingobium kunmingense]PKB14524.1 hypothetical protein B0I00_2114 [Novosphingobium kunmingense]